MSEFTFEDIAITLYDFLKTDRVSVIFAAYGCQNGHIWQGGVFFLTKDNKIIHAASWHDVRGYYQSFLTHNELRLTEYQKIAKDKKILLSGIAKDGYCNLDFDTLPRIEDLKESLGIKWNQ